MRTPQRGNIYRLLRDIAGKRRPVVIISRTELNRGTTVVAIPLTTAQFDKRLNQPSIVLLEAGEGGLTEPSLAKCGDIGSIRIADLDIANGPLGILDESQIERLRAAVLWSLGFD